MIGDAKANGSLVLLRGASLTLMCTQTWAAFSSGDGGGTIEGGNTYRVQCDSKRLRGFTRGGRYSPFPRLIDRNHTLSTRRDSRPSLPPILVQIVTLPSESSLTRVFRYSVARTVLGRAAILPHRLRLKARLRLWFLLLPLPPSSPVLCLLNIVRLP